MANQDPGSDSSGPNDAGHMTTRQHRKKSKGQQPRSERPPTPEEEDIDSYSSPSPDTDPNDSEYEDGSINTDDSESHDPVPEASLEQKSSCGVEGPLRPPNSPKPDPDPFPRTEGRTISPDRIRREQEEWRERNSKTKNLYVIPI